MSSCVESIDYRHRYSNYLPKLICLKLEPISFTYRYIQMTIGIGIVCILYIYRHLHYLYRFLRACIIIIQLSLILL